MRSKILRMIAIISFAYTTLSGIYLSLPIETKDLIATAIPQLNWFTVLISGSSTGIVGGTILYITSKIDKANIVFSEQKQILVNEIVKIKSEYDTIRDKFTLLEQKVLEQTNVSSNLNITLTELSTLLRADMEAKLSNALIDDRAKQIIEGVLYGDKEEEQEQSNL